MEISIDTLWQRISETTVSWQLGSIDTLWQRISEAISSKQLGCTWKFQYTSCGREYLKLLCLGNWDVHGNFYRHLVAENI